jgi:hypothetical protein
METELEANTSAYNSKLLTVKYIYSVKPSTYLWVLQFVFTFLPSGYMKSSCLRLKIYANKI